MPLLGFHTAPTRDFDVANTAKCKALFRFGALLHSVTKKLDSVRIWDPIIRPMPTTPHILVVDDDREIRSLVSQLLRKHDFRVTEAADGREMFQMLENGRFDLVVLDLMLPGEDGQIGRASCRERV